LFNPVPLLLPPLDDESPPETLASCGVLPLPCGPRFSPTDESPVAHAGPSIATTASIDHTCPRARRRMEATQVFIVSQCALRFAKAQEFVVQSPRGNRLTRRGKRGTK
jgi:hypothetical protein